MNLENTIQVCFDRYPSLFQTRHQVLNQLFCTIGNGYEWVNGELIDYEDAEPINALGEDGRAKQYNIFTKGVYRKEKYKKITENPEELELWKKILTNRETLEEHFLSEKEDDNELQYPIKDAVYPLCSHYSYLFNYPEDIKPDWLAGIKETYEYIIEKVLEDSEDCKEYQTFREVSKQELINIYNEKFGEN